MWPEMKYEIEESGLEFMQGWTKNESTIFDLRPENLYKKHTQHIEYQSFNHKDKLWGDKK